MYKQGYLDNIPAVGFRAEEYAPPVDRLHRSWTLLSVQVNGKIRNQDQFNNWYETYRTEFTMMKGCIGKLVLTTLKF
jgi:hypothetical protein